MLRLLLALQILYTVYQNHYVFESGVPGVNLPNALFLVTLVLLWSSGKRDAVALTLVSGLDLPWLPDGLQRDGPQAREPVDALLRGALAAAGIGYGMVYGVGAPRVLAALTAIVAMLA